MSCHCKNNVVNTNIPKSGCIDTYSKFCEKCNKNKPGCNNCNYCNTCYTCNCHTYPGHFMSVRKRHCKNNCRSLNYKLITLLIKNC